MSYNINMMKLVVAGLIVIAALPVPAGAKIAVPDIELPTSDAEFMDWVRTGIDEGLETAGINLERFPTIDSILGKFSEIRDIRVDDLPFVTEALESARGVVRGSLGIEAENLIQKAFEWGARLIETGIEWVRLNTQ